MGPALVPTEVSLVEEATVHWKITRPVKVNVSTNINTLTKRLMVLRPGTQLMGLWMPHTVGAQTNRDSYKNEHKKTILSMKAGLQCKLA